MNSMLYSNPFSFRNHFYEVQLVSKKIYMNPNKKFISDSFIGWNAYQISMPNIFGAEFSKL